MTFIQVGTICEYVKMVFQVVEIISNQTVLPTTTYISISLIINKYEIMKKYGKFGIKKYDTKMN